MSKQPPAGSQQGPATGTDPKKRPPKGHRQKGAGTVVVSKGEVKRDGLEIKEWQQTPKQLLQNYCKSEKRPAPRYVPASGAPSGKFLVRVILPDPKDQKEKDIVVVPKDTAFDTLVEAEHAVALLALQKVDGTRSHEMKLPEPYKSAWLKLVGRSAPAAAATGAAHTTQDEFSCEECGKGFAKAHALEHHKKTAHPKPKKTLTDQNGSDAIKEPAKEAPNTLAPPTPSPSPPPTSELTTAKIAGDKKEATNLMQLQSKSEFATERERQAFFERQRIERERSEKQKRVAESEDDDLVFMSEQNRSAIEQIVREAMSARNVQGDDLEGAEELTDVDDILTKAKPVIEGLAKRGFSRADARAAVLNGGNDLSSALDWLLVHLSEDRLPAGFDSRKLQLEVTLSGASKPAAETTEDSVVPNASCANVQLFAWAKKTFGDDFSEDVKAQAGDSSIEAEWRTEWEALESIFGHDVQMREDPESAIVTWTLKLENPQLAKESCLLDFRFNRSSYPCDSLPVVLIRNVSSSVAYASALALAEKARTFKGEASAYSLWDFASHMEVDTSSKGKSRATNNIEQPSAPVEAAASKRKKTSSGTPIIISKDERAKQSQELFRHLELRKQQDAKQNRKALPAHGFRQQILQAVRNNRVVIIKGETGCGKTTQVPQFIFEDFIERNIGGNASLVITQPRRLAAVSVATRVASEFGEEVGGAIGYRVQLEARAHPIRTRMEFVTTGLLLRRMQSDVNLRDVTHVIVDEVHERSLDSDFLLALLRDALKANKELKVVLMSATMDAGRFSEYFGGVPVLEIPGFTYPVKELYLEEVLERVPFALQNVPREIAADVVGYLERDVDYRFVALCVSYCHRELAEDGSILVFLSGVAEISKAIKACEGLEEGRELYLLPLHGALSGPDQRRVFERAPQGKRKVVVSTNVAETSVTIDDIVCVIDSGRMKEMRFDAFTKMSSLVDTWVSVASARQRKGRAGRVREGTCLKLFSRALKMDSDQLAEVHRVPLNQCVLQVATMGVVSDLAQFFDSLVEPPAHASVAAAVDALVNVGALEPGTSKPTPLGTHLSRLPMDIRLGKMLVFGSLLGVPEDVAILAAALSRRSPFLVPMPEKREAAKLAKKSLAATGVSNAAQSDHLVLVAAFEAWRACNSDKERRRFALDNFLVEDALREIDKLRREFLESLENIGFPRRNEIVPSGHPLLHVLAKKRRLIKASLCAGLYPNVVKIRRPSKRYVETMGGAFEAQASAKELRFELLSVDQHSSRTPEEGEVDITEKPVNKNSRVFLHPSSVNFEENAFNSNWIVFSDLVNTSKPFVRDCTVVSPYGLLLFGGALNVRHDEGIITCGSVLRFKCAPGIAVLIKEVKKLLDKSLMEKISNPDMNVGKCRVLEACKRLVEGDGFF